MTEQLLVLAKKHQDEHKWQKAIECFEQYLEENRESCSDTVYVSYARSLRIVGQTTLVKEVLDEGQKRFPTSEHILVELYKLYDFLGEWDAAKDVAMKLLKRNPKQADYHFRLGRSYSFLLNNKKAKKSYQTALEYKHNLPFSELVQTIQRGFTDNFNTVTSSYVFIDGKNNLGAFVHHDGEHRLFTKISNYTNKNNGAGREEAFYSNLCSSFPQLNNLVPRFVNSQIIDKVSYLTLEMINASPVGPVHIKKVIDTSQVIATIDYHQLAPSYKLPNYVFQFRKGRAISVVHFFTQIHEEAYNKKLFKAINLIMKQHQYPKEVRLLMKRLESAIMNHHLYSYIKPEKHYSLLHGDFAFQNILVDKDTERPYVIDWTSHTLGPHFIDLARYFTSLLLPYAQVKELYLNEADKKLSQIEQIFFHYALILFTFKN
ncbi:phosphotransferase [Anaerobacillus sp. CMMVII]|uniref:phosphotransferase n=1 Tax=Anaerobacillus sp. CMMVII TaxID=2755588 RepID=UPI0021B72A05|nr:phosphotransferase [Anaerobacillus sp. CMMVII]MCT8140009.1 phosphotransferase [Anaerobacillus sp. CMMVII]